MTLIIIELLSCLSAFISSFLYEGKALLLLGNNNYKIKLGCLEEFNDVLLTSFFPIIKQNSKKLLLYMDYFIFMIPIVNFFYSLVRGNKKCNTIIQILESKNIIIPMTDREKHLYNEMKNKMDKIHFILFNSMDTYKVDPVNDTINNNSYPMNDCSNQTEKSLEYCSIMEEKYQKDSSYLVSMFDFKEKKEENKVKRLKR